MTEYICAISISYGFSIQTQNLLLATACWFRGTNLHREAAETAAARLAEASEAWPSASRAFALASQSSLLVVVDLLGLLAEGPAETINDTNNEDPAVLQAQV